MNIFSEKHFFCRGCDQNLFSENEIKLKKSFHDETHLIVKETANIRNKTYVYINDTIKCKNCDLNLGGHFSVRERNDNTRNMCVFFEFSLHYKILYVDLFRKNHEDGTCNEHEIRVNFGERVYEI